VILGEAETYNDGSVAWPVAETRLTPEIITVDKGYMHGAAGIAGALLQLYQVQAGSFKLRRLADDPFPGGVEI
jgi:lantibiotic modifying enzyme